MKKAMVFMTSGLFFMFVSCKPQKDIFINLPDSQYVKKGLYPPCVSNCDSTVLFCAEYAYKPANHRKKDVCSCNLCKIELLDWNVSTHSGICNWTRSTIIVWDKKFISDYVLPLVEDEDSRNLIEFTLSHSDDSTFKAENVIDYENKVILNDKIILAPKFGQQLLPCPPAETVCRWGSETATLNNICGTAALCSVRSGNCGGTASAPLW